MSNQPSFAEFLAAAHDGREPFPWQAQLAQRVVDEGWPDLLDLPTGAGKTTALEIAIFGLALRPMRLPRRTVLVVDRRIVVDQAAAAARDLQRRLRLATTGPLRWIADALRQLWLAPPSASPFAVGVMRGGMPRDNDWARRPDQPMVGLATVDQFGSRLLFRGYGVGNRSVSIHAGLLGNDTLLLLDEVHLSQPFAETLEAVQGMAEARSEVLPQRFRVTQMTATPRAAGRPTSACKLGPDDLVHPVLGRRLNARKAARLIEVTVSGKDESKKRQQLAEKAVAEALLLQSKVRPVVGVVVNRVETARFVMQLLQGHGKTTDSLLVTGRMRPIDRDHVVESSLLPRVGVGRDRSAARPLVVVATQCIEAGADLDFDALVTECASLDALRQRFGRVDRRGELGDTASGILGRTDEVAGGPPDPVYGEALANTWRWLQKQSIASVVDFGIHAQRGTHPDVALLGPARRAPVLMPVHMDLWAQTTPRPAHDPDVALWLHGPKTQPADVQIVWRAAAAPEAGNEAALVEKLLFCRPSALEAMSLPLAAAVRWLSGESAASVADVVANGEVEEEEVRRRPRGSKHLPVALRWDGEESQLVTVEEIRPGDTLIVDANRGGITAGSFDPDSPLPVTDLGDLAQLRGRGMASLRVSGEELALWQLPPETTARMPRPTDTDEEPAETRERVVRWLTELPDESAAVGSFRPSEWKGILRGLRSRRLRIDIVQGQFVLRATVLREELEWEPEVADALTEDDDSSFRQAQVTLQAHSGGVRELAEQFAKSLGFPAVLVQDLALAAWLHDIGKADPRFQRWLVGGSEVRLALLNEPLAKSDLATEDPVRRQMARQIAGYPAGYRHELLSLAMATQAKDSLATAHDRDLVLHLIASHHGWCRPFPPPIDDPEDIPVQLEHGGVAFQASTRHRLARLDSGVAERFWALNARYGRWGLAWLEAVLRLADHRRSEAETEARS